MIEEGKSAIGGGAPIPGGRGAGGFIPEGGVGISLFFPNIPKKPDMIYLQ